MLDCQEKQTPGTPPFVDHHLAGVCFSKHLSFREAEVAVWQFAVGGNSGALQEMPKDPKLASEKQHLSTRPVLGEGGRTGDRYLPTL